MISSAITGTLLAAGVPDTFNTGVKVALVGMSTVFAGLLLLALCLPVIRIIAEGKRKPGAAIPEAPPEPSREEIVAITAAIHAHLQQTSKITEMKLTWEMYEKPYTPWRLAGRARVLFDRTPFRQRNRSR